MSPKFPDKDQNPTGSLFLIHPRRAYAKWAQSLNNFNKHLLNDNDSELLIFGPQQVEINTSALPKKIKMFRSIESFNANYLKENIFV